MNAQRQLLLRLNWSIAALLVAYAPQALDKPVWITGLLIGCAAFRWYGAHRRMALMPAWIRTPIGVACFFAVLNSYGSINGVEPGSALLSVMAALKLLETKNQRDLFVLLFICLFLILATFLQEQHLWSVIYLIAAYGVTMVAWMAVSREGALRSHQWYATQAGRGLMLATPILLAMWVLFPRVPGPFWAIPSSTSSASTGLSTTMSPGDISKLSESNEVAFRVRFDAEPPAQGELYWRAIVMRQFDGRSWSADEPVYTQNGVRAINAISRPVAYTVTMEPTNQRWLFTLDMPRRWEGKSLYLSRFQTLQRVQPIDERIAYRAVSYLDYQAAPALSSRARSWYTQLPSGGNLRTRAFVGELAGQHADPETFANALLQYFREESFFYTLSPPALGRNSVDDFLFGTRRGFCEHYASAFTFAMRAAGVPARVVAGYQGGEQNPLGDYMIVRQSDAHAWSEIWLQGRGWVRVDPTAAVAPQRIERNLDSALREIGERDQSAFDLPVLARLQLTWDVVNARWNEWVLGFGPETQRNFFEWLGIDDADWRDLTLLLTISLVVIMGIITFWLWRQHLPPRRDKAARQFAALQARLKLVAHAGEPPMQYARRAAGLFPDEADQIRAITHQYLRARYAQDDAAQQRLPTLVSKIKRRYRALPR